MNHDFEFKQLLRAYRAGIISEKTFESEMAELEQGLGTNGENGASSGFRAFGKTYATEREAVLEFLDKAHAGETNGAAAFENWAKVCTTDCIRSGLKMIAEREAYHARIFKNRLRELGAKPTSPVNEEGRKFKEQVSDPNMKDNEKLLALNKLVRDPAARFQPFLDFADRICEDLETKEVVKLFTQDEISSTNWLNASCAALNAAPAGVSASAAMSGDM